MLNTSSPREWSSVSNSNPKSVALTGNGATGGDASGSADALTRLQSELIGYQKLALLGNVAGMIAHEFNNLMTPVLARAQDALKHQEIPTMQRALQATVTRTQTAVSIAQQLLDLAHGARTVTEACSVASAVRTAVQLSGRPPERSNLELQVEVSENLRVWAAPLLLQQVLLNLVLNARNSMEGRAGRLRITAHTENSEIVIEVCDTGSGIPADRLRTVIAPFLQSNPETDPSDWQGVGMGLNVCRTIVHLHNGRIGAHTAAVQGSVFRLYWPSADAASEPPVIGRTQPSCE